MAVRGTIRCGIVEWMSKPTVETRAEKLRMKLENESRGENESREQPRTVEKVEKKLRKFRTIFSTLRMKVENKS